MVELTPGNPLPFVKMSGSGNDFILVDNREGLLDGMDFSALARRVCHRTTSVGADGLILIETSSNADFAWQFFNSDGSRAEMCGNGGRCAARFAFREGVAPARMVFETDAGLIRAEVSEPSVKIQLTRPAGYQPDVRVLAGGAERTLDFVNTGVPHAVIFEQELEKADVAGLGRLIRFHERFAPAGTNVNFARVEGSDGLKLRTYERGVEAETQACGTGSVAAAFAAWKRGLTGPVVEVETTGGEVLTVYIEPDGEESPLVFLEGKTIMICTGEIDPEAYRSSRAEQTRGR